MEVLCHVVGHVADLLVVVGCSRVQDTVAGRTEDDDYCRRLRLAGYSLCCRQDAFVHHWQQATFSLLDAERYLDLYERNRQYYRDKWRRRGRRDVV